MPITIHRDIAQGTEEWHQLRCGLLTASQMNLILTPTLKVANNEKTRAHLYELLAQRITGYVEPVFESFDMLRGKMDEVNARGIYARTYGDVDEVGFIINDRWGFRLGYSPDGLVGADGLIEIKSRRQKYQVQTILVGEVPDEYMLQIQTGLLVSERKWCDFVTYCGGLPMFTVRVEPIREIQDAILAAAADVEERLKIAEACYRSALTRHPRLVPTERTIDQEIH